MRFISYRVRCGETVHDYGCGECVNGTCECLFDALTANKGQGAKSRMFGVTEDGRERCLASCQAEDVEERGPLAYVPRRQTAARAMRARRKALTLTMRGAA